ncbi:SDR family NAD(P)-dependent oxidoreductase [Casimicrobium huifangae]|uniref:SDR family NAD(P)-dependent oxidoreductase n=1 Tax=Casimicrobium huifangae TaxID=2591109 RepID=UPI0012EB662A|nr:SDR family NAD(P)-dependent oxidoreductase [Casimicrobium huifangae]
MNRQFVAESPPATPVAGAVQTAQSTRWPWWRSPNRRRADWQGQRVWLIGASSGIGAALAAQLMARGASVALSARNVEALQRVADGASAGSNGRALVLPFDATQQGQWAGAHGKLNVAWGGVDVVVFCAGAYAPMRAWEIDDRQMSQIVDVNLRSVYHGLERVIPDLRAGGTGALVLVASVAGLMGLPNATVYGPTKAALINLAELLHSDLRGDGVDVYLVNPGFVQTPLTAKNEFPMPAIQTPEQAAQAIMRGLAAGRFSIHFPKRFTGWLYLLRHLPDRVRLAIVRGLMAARPAR